MPECVEHTFKIMDAKVLNATANQKRDTKLSSSAKNTHNFNLDRKVAHSVKDSGNVGPSNFFPSDQKRSRSPSLKNSCGAKGGGGAKESIENRGSSNYFLDIPSNQTSAERKVKAITPRNTEIVPDTSSATIGKGLRINEMSMKDSDKNVLLWAQNCRDINLFDGEEHDAHLPASILQCSAVTRTINFSSIEKITSFSLIQKVFLHGSCIEKWSYQFGFVIPGSTNSWEQTIYAAPRTEMLPLDMLNGNVIIETQFLNKDEIVAKSRMKIFYDK